MTAVPVAAYLVDFHRPHHRVVASGPGVDLAGAWPVAAPDTADDVAAAETRGREVGLAEGRAEFAQAIVAEREQAALSLAAARDSWTRDEAERLAAALDAGLAGIRETLAASVARLVAPLMQDAHRAAMLDDLVAGLRNLQAHGEAPLLRISGPEDLLAKLRERLTGYPAAIEYQQADAADIRVEAGDTVFETQLRQWGERLAGIVG